MTNAGRDGIKVISITRLILSCAAMLALHVFGVWKWWELLRTGAVDFGDGPERWPQDGFSIVVLMSFITLQFGFFPLLWWQIRRGRTVIRG